MSSPPSSPFPAGAKPETMASLQSLLSSIGSPSVSSTVSSASYSAATIKVVQPTESVYQLSDGHYRYAARRDVGLPPSSDTILPRQCGACGLAMAADGRHGQRCVYNSTYTTLRHDSIEQLLHSTIIGGIGRAYRQQRNMAGAGRTIPDLVIYLDNKAFLCDVTVADTLADSNLKHSSKRPGQLARQAARAKVEKYKQVEEMNGLVHLPFAVESMGGLSESAQLLIREIHHSASSHCTWRDANAIGTHLVDSIAIAVQRCTGMALQASADREMQLALGAAAA